MTEYYEGLGIKVKYLHSDIHTVERSEIIRDLRLGVFDVLVGINLLREGLDIPEVSLVAITDADKEGFLRSERSLIQTIGRAARNAEGVVILYADRETDSMKKAIHETQRRRKIQNEYNIEHGITPKTVHKKVSKGLLETFGYENLDLDQTIKPKSKVHQVILEGDPKKVDKEIQNLRRKMKKFSENLEFEEAAKCRDEVKRLQLMQLEMLGSEG